MLLKINGPKPYFWQWDLNQQLIVGDDTCGAVHFCNGTTECALVCEIYDQDGKRVVDVPNILLQSANMITAYLYLNDARQTRHQQSFQVAARNKPDDYVYTETEVLSYLALEERLKRVEEAGGAINGVPSGGKAGQYLRKKSDNNYDLEWADIEIPEQYGLVTYDQDKTITIT